MTDELALSLQMGTLRLRNKWPGDFASSGRVRTRVTGQTLWGQTGNANSWSRRSVAHTGRGPQRGVGWVALGPKRISFLVPWDNACSPQPCSSESRTQNFVSWVEHTILLCWTIFTCTNWNFTGFNLKFLSFEKSTQLEWVLSLGQYLVTGCGSVTPLGTAHGNSLS